MPTMKKTVFLIVTFTPFSKLFIESGYSGTNNNTNTIKKCMNTLKLIQTHQPVLYLRKNQAVLIYALLSTRF